MKKFMQKDLSNAPNIVNRTEWNGDVLAWGEAVLPAAVAQ
jgi:hypothetical protein